MIAPNIKWNHEENYFVPYFDSFSYYERRKIVINLNDKEFENIKGHNVEGRVLYPAAGWIYLVWETFGMINGIYHENLGVIFEDIKLLRATSLLMNQDVYVTINIQRGTGRFEIVEGDSAIANGFIKVAQNAQMTDLAIPTDSDDDVYLNENEFFKILRLRGYYHHDQFRAVSSIRDDCARAKVKWHNNWMTFIDSLTFVDPIRAGKRDLLVPTDIRKLIINPKAHQEVLEQHKGEENILLDVVACPHLRIIKSGGVEIHDNRKRPLTRRRPREPLLEVNKFIPFFSEEVFSKIDVAKILTQLLLETTSKTILKSVEIDNENPFSSFIVQAVADLPTITPEVTILTSRNLDLKNVTVDSENELSSFSDVDFVIANNCANDIHLLKSAQDVLNESGFIISRESRDVEITNELCQLISRISIGEEILHVLRFKREMAKPVKVIQLTSDVKEWIEELKVALEQGSVLLYSQADSTSGILGFVNCLRKEPNGSKLRCFFINDESAPTFDIDNVFYKSQLDLGHSINVFKDGQWGTYRHLQLNHDEKIAQMNYQCNADILVKGDLSSLAWLQGQTNLKKSKLDWIKIQYAALNFKDVMLAVGSLEESSPFGFEFSGVYEDGRRVMGIAREGGALTTYYESKNLIEFDIPVTWTMEQAATVPVVYYTVYFAFFVTTKIQKGKSILIHAGSGGVGQAAIRVAFAYGLDVFTTVSTEEKRNFLLEKFPQLKAENIGNSRDISFEKMIQERTNGKGVDYVLNSLSDDKLQASIRCLGMNGIFLEIGKFDIFNKTNIHMGHLAKRITFKAVFMEDLATFSDEMMVSEIAVLHNNK